MARTFKIYKKGALDTPVVSGASPLTLTGLTAETTYAKGDYVISAVEDGKESEKVDIPAFTTTATAG